MAAQQSATLPNLSLIGQALDTVKVEVVKVANLPSWDGGAAIITRLDQLMTRIDQRFEQMEQQVDRRFQQMEQQVDQRFQQMDQRFEQINQRFQEVDQRFQQINQRFQEVDQRFQQVEQHLTTMDANIQSVTTRLNATQHNTNAQFANYTAYSDNSPLVPLHHYITNEDIDGFPATTGDIYLLNRQMADTILEALGGSTGGTLEKKRSRVRRLVGMIPIPEP